MVSKWWTRRHAHFFVFANHQSKIYVESNHSNFLRIFGEFTSMQTLAIYRRLIVRSKAAGITATGPKETTGVARCSFCFAWCSGSGWCSCCCPEKRRLKSDKLPQIGASEAVSAATAAVSDMGQFCKRQPAACEVGGQAATVIGQRAQDGARKLYQIITDKPDKPKARQEGPRPHRLDRRLGRRRSRAGGHRAARYADARRSRNGMARHVCALTGIMAGK